MKFAKYSDTSGVAPASCRHRRMPPGRRRYDEGLSPYFANISRSLGKARRSADYGREDLSRVPQPDGQEHQTNGFVKMGVLDCKVENERSKEPIRPQEKNACKYRTKEAFFCRRPFEAH
jgi:hypothetical protein